jgi:hypothetical protein
MMQTLIRDNDLEAMFCSPAIDICLDESELTIEIPLLRKLHPPREHVRVQIQAMELKALDAASEPQCNLDLGVTISRSET